MLKFLNQTSRFCYAPEGDATGGGGGDPAAAAAANAAPAIAWLPKATPEDVSYVQSKGWDKSENPSETILQSYRHLEKLNGAVAGGKAIMPLEEGADQATKDAYFEKLGRPKDVTGYEIAEPFAGMSPEISEGLVKLAHEQGFTKAQVQALHKWNGETAAQINNTFEANTLVENQRQVDALKKDWGAAYDTNIQYAKEAVTKLGWTPEIINNMQIGLGYDGVMKLATQIGKATGEGTFVGTGDGGGGRGGADNVMTPAQAQLELGKLGNDPVFAKSWMDKNDVGHAAAVARKSQLTKWAYPNG